ncbi:AAC(3) family N-acetyltransferase [Pseudoalteromonas sp. MQS005]|uniref:AAC(3) family N-acetyltransferase n=1 Tax=Pseudoalteromonas sp. MQS005 TaxID=1854052 RepID=UPI0007E519B5|nr:AAC(3) family N-acetyltransferase [Pseudoalteromonas sp. MQS005]
MIAYLKSSSLFQILRKYKYKMKRKNSGGEKTSLAHFRNLLVNDLYIQKGDSIIVHCGFGFLNADFTPNVLITTLKEVVGPNGHIMMPFYPPGLSRHWLESGRVFDAKTIRCSTGALAQVFSQTENVQISIHPIKAVAVWGENARQIVKDHEKCAYPYDEGSPYYKFSQLKNAKAIGLGVRNCSVVHMLEDMFEQDKEYLYSKTKMVGKVKTNFGMQNVDTYYHHGDVSLIEPKDFLDKYCPELVILSKKTGFISYSISTESLLGKGRKLFSKGVNRQCH